MLPGRRFVLLRRRFVSDIGFPIDDVRHRVDLALRAGGFHLANLEAAMIDAPKLPRRRNAARRETQDDKAALDIDHFHPSDRSKIRRDVRPGRLLGFGSVGRRRMVNTSSQQQRQARQSSLNSHGQSKIRAGPIVKSRGTVRFLFRVSFAIPSIRVQQVRQVFAASLIDWPSGCSYMAPAGARPSIPNAARIRPGPGGSGPPRLLPRINCSSSAP